MQTPLQQARWAGPFSRPAKANADKWEAIANWECLTRARRKGSRSRMPSSLTMIHRGTARPASSACLWSGTASKHSVWVLILILICREVMGSVDRVKPSWRINFLFHKRKRKNELYRHCRPSQPEQRKSHQLAPKVHRFMRLCGRRSHIKTG